jgi:hypothetical protein
MMKGDEDTRLEASAYPLIVFVHVPKTAGSTVTRTLQLCTPRGYRDVQYLVDNRTKLVDAARNSDWVSGHVPRDRMAKALIWLNRPVEYFASVREPTAQLVSHLNWCFEQYNRPGYYDLADRIAKTRDAEVMSADFSRPAAIIALLLRHARHYLNSQSRYVLGYDFAEISDDEVARRLATYTYVATETSLPALNRAFGFLRVADGVDEVRANVAEYHFDSRAFYTQEMQEFLARFDKHDLRLYAAVRAASWPAEGRRPFRPALLEGQVFTSENFDEQNYLVSHPGIADAVKRGDFKSGRAHFECFGYKENRTSRRWVLPLAARSEQTSTEEDLSASSALNRLRRFREDRTRPITVELRSRRQLATETAC